jgi:epoxyqueuosine reductase
MITSKTIKKIANRCGADLCGIASVERFKQAPEGFHPIDIYPSTRSIIAFARKIPDSAFASHTPVPYTFLITLVLNEVYQLTLHIVRELDYVGVTAVPVPSEPYESWDKETMTGKGIVSLRHAAYLAGIGVIGRNHLLTNRRYGNRITLGAVLTDVELAPDPIGNEPICPSGCNVCRSACPVNAIRREGVIQKLCRSKAEGFNDKGYYLYWCWACREKCPNSKGLKAEKASARRKRG